MRLLIRQLKEIIDIKGEKYYSKNVVIAAGAYSKFFINQIKEVNKKIPDLFFGSANLRKYHDEHINVSIVSDSLFAG